MPNLNYPYLSSFILFFLCPFGTKAQTVYEGQVVNAITQEALIKASVTLQKAKQGTASNQQGYFRLIVENSLPNDTLIVTFVGFKTSKLAVSAYQPNVFIGLDPVSGQLAQVTVGATKARQKTIENFNYADVHELRGREYYPVYAYKTSGLFAKQFEAPTEGTLLNTVNLGRKIEAIVPYSPDDYSLVSSNKLTRFLLHIMSIDSVTGAPSKKLYTKEVTLNDNSLRITFDLTKERITLPEKKFYVAIEWLLIPLNEIVGLTIGEKAKGVKEGKPSGSEDVSSYMIMYQPILAILPQAVPPNSWVPRLSKVPIWTSSDGVKWRQTPNAHDIALSATVTY
jgi:hypothetical protein